MAVDPRKSTIQLSIPTTTTKSLQSCPTLCNPIDGSPPGSPVPGILQARTLEWVAISFSNAWKWKVKGKSLSRVRLPATPTDLLTKHFQIRHVIPSLKSPTGGCHSQRKLRPIGEKACLKSHNNIVGGIGLEPQSVNFKSCTLSTIFSSLCSFIS